MEELYDQLYLNNDINEDTFIKELDKLLKKGNEINYLQVFFSPAGIFYRLGTILHLAIRFGYNKIIKFALEKEADIAEAYTTHHMHFVDAPSDNGSWNSLEYAIIQYNSFQNIKYGNCFELLKNTFLAKYSVYGLHQLDIACARGNWSEIEKHLTPSLVNKSINVRSPVWPGMTPILIASKFGHWDVVDRLVDFGASLLVRDFKGNTVLHYMSVHNHYDRRFFIHNEDTFGSYTGMSHFHIACKFCPETIDIVEKYLKQVLEFRQTWK